MDKSFWQETVGENVHKKALGSRYRYEGRICTEERKGVSVVERGERRGARVHQETTEERVHLTLKVTSNGASVLCRKKRWEEENSARLSIFQ